METLQALRADFNRHLTECADMNGQVRAELAGLKKAVWAAGFGLVGGLFSLSIALISVVLHKGGIL